MKTGLGMEFFVDYSHLLPGHPKCGVLHGHTAKVIVELFGEVRPDGMIMDFKDMENKSGIFSLNWTTKTSTKNLSALLRKTSQTGSSQK